MSNAADFGLTPAPGESSVTGIKYMESVVLPWMKGTLLVSSMRIAFRDPNTVLGFIPVGTNEQTIPLRAVASVSSSVKFRLGTAVLGLISLIAGVSLLGSSAALGAVLILLAIAWLANCVQTILKVTNQGGGVSFVSASIFDKAKLEQFTAEANQRIFADNDQLRHEEAMGFSQRSEFLQAQMLQGQMMQNQMMQNQMTAQQQPMAQQAVPQVQQMAPTAEVPQQAPVQQMAAEQAQELEAQPVAQA